MSQGNGSVGGADVESRVVSVAYPLTFAEFQTYYDQGYQVATTAEQRAAWGLDPVENLSVLSHEQALRVLFAEPGDPIPRRARRGVPGRRELGAGRGQRAGRRGHRAHRRTGAPAGCGAHGP